MWCPQSKLCEQQCTLYSRMVISVLEDHTFKKKSRKNQNKNEISKLWKQWNALGVRNTHE